MDDTGFTLTRDGHVAILTFSKPNRLNALTKAQLIAFGEQCRALAVDAEVRCLVITGEGRAFSAGADVKAVNSNSAGGDFATPVRFMDTRLDFVTPLIEFPKPAIAAVNGIAVGGGFGIALACDIRICGESGAFLGNFADLGLPAIDGVPWLMSRLAGVGRTLEALYLGDRIGAEAALAMGLVNRVVPDADMRDEALALAQRIAAKSPVAIQMTKAAVLGAIGRPWPEALARQEFAYVSTMAFSAPDIAEIWAARAEKRTPEFRCAIPFDAGGG